MGTVPSSLILLDFPPVWCGLLTHAHSPGFCPVFRGLLCELPVCLSEQFSSRRLRPRELGPLGSPWTLGCSSSRPRRLRGGPSLHHAGKPREQLPGAVVGITLSVSCLLGITLFHCLVGRVLNTCYLKCFFGLLWLFQSNLVHY